jgi:hypothetical protein
MVLAAREWAGEARSWVGVYLALAVLLFVPLAANPALGRALELQARPIQPGRPLYPLPHLALGPSLFDLAWGIALLLPLAAVARAVALGPRGPGAVLPALRRGWAETARALLGWALGMGAVAAAGLAAALVAPGAVRAVVVAAVAAAALAAWGVGFWLLALVGREGAAGAEPRRLGRWLRAQPAAAAVGVALWTVSAALVGMLAAAVTWTSDLWAGMAFEALALAGAWLLAVRTAIVFASAQARSGPRATGVRSLSGRAG